MKKYILSVFAIGFIVAPLFSFAQVEYPDPGPSTSNCVYINNNLRYRDMDIYKNNEVSSLQDFLQTKGYLNNEPTGYFGLLTLSAVRSFQMANSISATGYVGPITREKIRALTCERIYPNFSKPVISGTQGPQSLKINETGTWRILATDASGGDLSYSVNWGDVNVGLNLSTIYPVQNNLPQSSTFTHSYSQAGNYTAVFTVTNNLGRSTTTSLSVNVVNVNSVSSITVLSPNGGEVIQRGQFYTIRWSTAGFSSSDNVTISLKDDSINCLSGMVGCWTAFGIITVPNTGSYTWNTNQSMSGDGGPNTVPAYAGNNFRISLEIYSANNSALNASDYSDNHFTIQ